MLVYVNSAILSYIKYFVSLILLYSLTLTFRLDHKIPDFLYKVRLNDYFFCNFYLFWTNLHYLPLLILLLLLIFLLKLRYLLCYSVMLPFFIGWILLVTLSLDFTYMFYGGAELEIFIEGVNKLLTNSINKIHPPLLYYSTFITVYSLLHTLSTHKELLLYDSSYFYTFFKVTYFYLITCLLSLYLGSWWALQEGSWGGWWNWDSSEVFGVLIFFKLIILYHLTYFTHHSEFIISHLKSSLFTIFAFYLFMQLNFSLISHNFSSKNYQLVSLDFFYTIWLLLTFLVKVKFHRNYAIIYSYIYISCRDTFFKNTLLTKYLILITLYLSILPLFNNFFWHKLGLNLINYPPSFFKITLIFIIIILTIIYINNPFTFFFFFLISQPLKLGLFINILKSVSFSRNIHYTLLLLFVYTLFIASSLITNWSYGYWLNFNNGVFSLTTNASNLYYDFNFISNFNSLDNRTFILFFENGITSQNFFISHNINKILMSTLDVIPGLISSLILIFFLTFFYILMTKAIL